MVIHSCNLCMCCTALYARISVQCNQCKLKYQKSSTVARCLVTVFNEVLLFSLPEVHLERCKILVSIHETRPTSKSAKQLIGQLIVGKEKSSEDEHWTLMMRSVRQPVAKWHGLLIWISAEPTLSSWMSVFVCFSLKACVSDCSGICTCWGKDQTCLSSWSRSDRKLY